MNFNLFRVALYESLWVQFPNIKNLLKFIKHFLTELNSHISNLQCKYWPSPSSLQPLRRIRHITSKSTKAILQIYLVSIWENA